MSNTSIQNLAPNLFSYKYQRHEPQVLTNLNAHWSYCVPRMNHDELWPAPDKVLRPPESKGNFH